MRQLKERHTQPIQRAACLPAQPAACNSLKAASLKKLAKLCYAHFATNWVWIYGAGIVCLSKTALHGYRAIPVHVGFGGSAAVRAHQFGCIMKVRRGRKRELRRKEIADENPVQVSSDPGSRVSLNEREHETRISKIHAGPRSVTVRPLRIKAGAPVVAAKLRVFDVPAWRCHELSVPVNVLRDR